MLEYLVFCHCGIILRTPDRKEAMEAKTAHRKANPEHFVQFRRITRRY